MIFNKKIIQNDLFEGIMGINEYKEYQKELTSEDRKDIVLISIREPEEKSLYLSIEDPIYTIGYHDVLETKFWDVETQIGNYPPLSKEQGIEIKEFIIKNKDKKFLIHCKAGMSRSSAVGKAVECIVNFNGNVYEYRISHSDIDDYERYEYNFCVFNSIVN